MMQNHLCEKMFNCNSFSQVLHTHIYIYIYIYIYIGFAINLVIYENSLSFGLFTTIVFRYSSNRKSSYEKGICDEYKDF